MAQMISSSPLASAFRCFQFDLNGAPDATPTKLSEAFLVLRDYAIADEGSKLPLMVTALKAIRNLSQKLQNATVRARDLSLNPKVQRCYDDGIELVLRIKESTTPQAWSQTALKIKSLALTFLPANGPIETLIAQANAQKASIESIELCSGLCGLNEIVAHRPHLSQHAAFPQSLAHIASIITKLMPCFAEVGFNPQKRQEGIFLVKELAKQLTKYQEILKRLYVPGSPVSILIEALVNLNADPTNLAAFFDSMRNTLIDACYDREITPPASNGVTPAHITQLFEIQAKVTADALPDHLKPNHAQTGQELADVFKGFEFHHGVLLFDASTGGGKPYDSSATWGSKLPSNDGTTPVNGANPQGHSNQMVEKLQKIVALHTFDFYNHFHLAEQAYLIDGENILTEEVTNPLRIAYATVKMIAQYEVEQHIRDQGLLFGLDANQREALEKEKTIQIVVFGIRYDMFSPMQIICLQECFPHLQGNEQIGQALAAALSRLQERELRAEEVSRFPADANVEIAQLMSLPTSAPDEEEAEHFRNMTAVNEGV